MIAVLVLRPHGLFARAAMRASRRKACAPACPLAAGPRSSSGWSRFAALLLPPGKHLMLNEIAILALFALSLDLILGYAGIVSLGHAAFFGAGAYAAGHLRQAGDWRSAGGWRVAIVVAARAGLRSPASWCCAAAISRA